MRGQVAKHLAMNVESIKKKNPCTLSLSLYWINPIASEMTPEIYLSHFNVKLSLLAVTFCKTGKAASRESFQVCTLACRWKV